MKTRTFGWSLLSILVLLACGRDDDELACVGQGNRVVDVIAGNALSFTADEHTAFLSNEYGGRGERKQVTGYPMFLNWLDGCQDLYTVNILSHIPEQIDPEALPLVLPEHAQLRSHFAVPEGQSVDLNFLWGSVLFELWRFPARSLQITGIPAWDELITIPKKSSLEEAYPTGEGTLSTELGTNFAGGSTLYLIFKLAGTTEYRGIRLQDDDQSASFDFATDAVPVELRQIELGEDVDQVRISRVVDSDEIDQLYLGARWADEGVASFLVPPGDGPYIVHCRSSSLGVERFSAQLLADFPTYIGPSFHEPDPLGEMSWTEDFLKVDLNLDGYFKISASTSYDEEPFKPATRSLEGPLSSGEHTIRIPAMPPDFLEDYPALEWVPNLFDYGYTIQFWNIPATSSLADYRNLDIYGYPERNLYHYYKYKVE